MSHTRNIAIGIAGIGIAVGVVTTGSAGAGAGGSGEAVAAQATIIDSAGVEVGVAKFVEDGSGVVHVNLKVAGLPAGKHGVHIHETASCASASPAAADLFSGAGGHYNPGGSGVVHANHAGDLPNLIVNGEMRGKLNARTERVTLSAGPTTVFDQTAGKVGSAIIIHANEDDFGSVANGNSGGRIACGVIVPK